MSSVVIAGDTSGTVTLQAPAEAGSTVLTLPNTSGSLLNITTGGVFNVPGVGIRIQADWSQATFTNRAAIQTSTLNSGTIVNFLPNGTGVGSVVDMYDKDNFTDSTRFRFGISASECYISQNTQGTGTFLPLNIYTGGSERMRIATDGTITSTLGGMQVRSGTAVASTSGTSIDFTGIPSWAKRITVMFNGLSTNGGSNYQVQLGDSGGIETSGYVGRSNNSNGSVRTLFSSGFIFVNQNDTNSVVQGQLIFSNLSSFNNTWVGTGMCGTNSGSDNFFYSGGSKTLSATLDRIRITTVNGTDTFDAGLVNILYE